MQRGWQRFAVLAGCLGFAAMAVGSGLDRQARTAPATAGRVPALFASDALLATADRQLDAGDFRAAAETARRAIRVAPVEPGSTALLGAARYGMEDMAGADRAFRVAGNFGWRTALTQYYWMGEALTAGDFRIAALRLDALLRQDPGLVGEEGLMAPLELDPRGRGAMVDRLLVRPDWLGNYATDVYNLPPDILVLRSEVLTELARRGLRLGCRDIGPMTRALVAGGLVAQGHGLWQAHCPVARTGVINDASFARLEVHQADSPFEWAVIGDSDVSVNLEANPDGQGYHLGLASSASFARKVLMQLVMAPPGRYRLSWRARAPDGTPSARIAATFGCDDESRAWVPGALDKAGGRWVATVEATSACPASWLAFTLQPGNDSVELDQVSLEAAR